MELVSEWYSRNLSQETRKGKRERALQGRHNNPPPFGYDQTEDGKMTPNPKEAEGVRLAFEWFSMGKYYDMDIARMLNERGFRTKQGLLQRDDSPPAPESDVPGLRQAPNLSQEREWWARQESAD